MALPTAGEVLADDARENAPPDLVQILQRRLRWMTRGAIGVGVIAILAAVWIFVLAPRLNAGAAAVIYINRCIGAGICPTEDQVATKLKEIEQAKAAAPVPAAATPHPVPPPPAPAPAEKK